jgi:hypothetical protein
MSHATDTLEPVVDDTSETSPATAGEAAAEPDRAVDAAKTHARHIRARRSLAIAAVAVLALWIIGTQVLPDKPSPDSAPATTQTPVSAPDAPVDDLQRAPDPDTVRVANGFAEAYATYLSQPDARGPLREFDRHAAPALARALTQAAKRMPRQPARSVDDLFLQALPAGQWRVTARLLVRDDPAKSWPLVFTLADRGGQPQVISLP